MKLTFFAFLIMCISLIAGCVANEPVPDPNPPVATCPMPRGYQLESAIETAEQTLTICPDRLDRVFFALLDIAKHSPAEENGLLIQDMLKRLIEQNKISEAYTRTLYQKYFSRKFVSLPDLKAYNLHHEMDSIKEMLRGELALKREGMVDGCDDKVSYQQAEREYVRVVRFMENLVYNQEYLTEKNTR